MTLVLTSNISTDQRRRPPGHFWEGSGSNRNHSAYKTTAFAERVEEILFSHCGAFESWDV